MTPEEIAGEYERETDNVIIGTFQKTNLSAEDIPSALVHSHEPFAWGSDPMNAVHNAVMLEELAFMAFHTEAHTPNIALCSRNCWINTTCASIGIHLLWAIK